MNWLLGAILIFMGAMPALAEQLPPPPVPAMPKTLPMQSTLYDAELLAKSGRMSTPELRAELERRNITLSDEGLVHVEIVGPKGSEGISKPFVESFGGYIENRARHRVDGWIPVERLSKCARDLPEGFFIENVHSLETAEVIGEGPYVINSDDYPNGAGMTVAICDLGFTNLSGAIGNGDAPPVYAEINYTGEPFQSGTIHGTGCTEAVYDHCPGASYRLYKLDGLVDLWNATLDALANGVGVMSLSVNAPAGGWADDEGDAADGANLAAANGIVLFVAAGNYAESHWQGTYVGGLGDPDWHDFSAGGDETIDIRFLPGESASFNMQWNTSGGTYDYDLYLYDGAGGILKSSTNPGNYYEGFDWTNESSDTVIVNLAVYRDDGGSTEFELFSKGGTWLEYIVPWSSTADPNNATEFNVITVGAVTWSHYGEPPGTPGIAASYSSQGPSNGGTPLPDICGPTDTNTFVYGGPMGGTSNATPNCAGAAVCLWSSDPLMASEAITWLVMEQAYLYKDWGDPGQDLIYGFGGMRLIEPAPNTLWVSRVFGNFLNLREYPFFTVAAAQTNGVSGGRIVFIPGGEYPEPVTLNKQLRYVTIESSAILGE